MSRFSFFAAFAALLLCALRSTISARPLFPNGPSNDISIASHIPHYTQPTPAAPPAPSTPRDDDCQMRSFTLAYVAYLAQAAVVGNWTGAAHDAIQIDKCTAPAQRWESEQPISEIQWSEREREVLSAHNALDGRPAAPSCQWEVFVSPDGSDDDKGDLASPLRTIHRALAMSRQVPRPTPYTSNAASPIACITLREGTYYLGYNASADNTAIDSRVGAIHLTAADSGLVIQGMSGESVTLSGGVPLSVEWRPWREGSYRTSFDSSNIPAADRWHFNELYVNNQRAVRAKYPNGDPAIHGLWDHTGWIPSANVWTPPAPTKPAVEIAMSSPTRVGHFRSYQIGVGGPAAAFDPPQSFWATAMPPAGATYAVPSGMTLDNVTRARARRWSDPTSGPAYVFAFHDGHWGSWVWDVAGLNNVTGEVMFGSGGFQEARGSDGGAEFYVSNILEELDAPNEFYIDYSNSTLYYMPNASSSIVPDTYVASQLPCILSIQGTSDQPVHDVSIVGITFAHTASTFLRPYEVPSGGDWSVHRGGAVYLDNTVGVSFSYSTFTQLGGNGVVISNYNLAPTIIFSEFVWLGESAIVLLGSVSGIDGVTNRQQPTNAFIAVNLIHELGAYVKQTAGIVQFLSRNTYISKNAMFNMPRAGININDGAFGGMSIEGNVIFNTVRETSDHGPINSWDRQPYLVDHGDGPTTVPLRNYITANLLFNCYANDDGSSYYTDSYNVLMYGGYKDYLGHAKTAHNQLYLFPDGQRFDSLPAFAEHRISRLDDAPWGQACGQYFSAQLNDSGFDEYYYNNTCIMQSTGNVHSFPFGMCDATNPQHQAVMPHTGNNTYYTPPKAPFMLNCIVNGNSTNLNFTAWQATGQDRGSVQITERDGVLAMLLKQGAEMLGMSGERAHLSAKQN